MKRIISIFVTALITLSSTAQHWPEVTTEMRPGTRWWWLGSAVDTLNLRKNIDEYSRAGIGSVEITPIYGVVDNESNDIPYLSPKWMEMLNFVHGVAKDDSMLVDMNQGTGWPFGGPEVSVDDAACKVVFLVDTVARGGASIKQLPPKEAAIAIQIAESRRNLPDEKEEIIRAYQSRTGQEVKNAAPGGEGFVMDHFNREAVARYLDKFDKAFRSTNTPWPHNFFNDSYEVFRANWTPAMFDEFAKRRGYRLESKMPELLGLVDDGNEVLSDYRETLGELLLENFAEQWTKWAHERGVKVRNQAHGSPANLIDIYAAVDVPEIEGFGLSDFGIKGLRKDSGFTRRNDSDVSMLKYASSAAHITGKPLTSSETFTWLTEHFRTSLSQMKPDLDLMFTCGVNHMFFHGTTYSPVDDAWPGWKFYASVDMSPTNSIWRDAPALMDYITRSQSMLQQGRPDNDFLVYLPIRDLWHQRKAPGEQGLLLTFSIHNMGRMAPDFIKSVMKIDSLGYDCDYISDRYLMSTRYEGGKLVTAAGTPYKGLIIPGSGKLSPSLAAHIDSLKMQGANIIYGVNSDKIKAAAKDEQMRSRLGLRAIRRAVDDGYIYFIANLSDEDVDASVPLTVGFADAAWFEPLNGDIYKADVNGDKVNIALRSGESRILKTYNAKINIAAKPRLMASKVIDLGKQKWNLVFVESTPAVSKKFKLDSVKPWTAMGDSILDQLVGTGVYTTELKLTAAEAKAHWQLNLGDVRESARVYINDKYIATLWSVPYVLDIDNAFKAGKNTIRIEVTNLPANRIAALDRAGVPWRKFKKNNILNIHYKRTNYSGWDVVPSGLLGPVTLTLMK